MYNMDISFMGYKFNVEILILIGVVYLILVSHTVCSTCNTMGIIETFVGASINNGQSSEYSLKNNKPVDTSSWSQPSLTVVSGEPVSPAVQQIMDRKNQSLPLPEGQMDILSNMPFKPECCPNTYSNSMGCACMNPTTYNYLINRGGNNVPYSEY